MVHIRGKFLLGSTEKFLGEKVEIGSRKVYYLATLLSRGKTTSPHEHYRHSSHSVSYWSNLGLKNWFR